MTIGSLFSGIGGLELGLEWAGLGPVIWQVEKDEKCRNCLAHHWPDAKRFEDVCTVGKDELEPVDLICGGFPCQDISSAGNRAGLRGARSGLWFQMARLVGELRPRWIVIENVSSGARSWIDPVRDSLGELGYASLPIPLSAADCGAWHERERVFVIANRIDPQPGPQRSGQAGRAELGRSATDADRFELREQSGRRGRPSREEARIAAIRASNPDGERKLQQGGREREIGRWTCDGSIWAAEPNVARMVHGFPGRVDRERALGNSVVPQCAEVIGEVIKLLEYR